MPDFDPCPPGATQRDREVNCPFRADIAVIRTELASISGEQRRLDARITADRQHLDHQVQAIMEKLNGSGAMPALLDQARHYTDAKTKDLAGDFGKALAALQEDVKALAKDLTSTRVFVAALAGGGGLVGGAAGQWALQLLAGG